MKPLLKVTGLTKRYAGVTALRDVSFELFEGEILAILGPNGSGKTTLFNVMSGFVPPTSGRMTLSGKPTPRGSPSSLVRLGICRSFQEAMCFTSFTVRENLEIAPRYGIAPRKRSDVAELLVTCGLEAVADRPSSALPYGVQRKLGVAIALSTQPRILLLDEPGAGLSEADSIDLAAVIKKLPDRGVSVICIDHNLPFLLPIADRVVVLDAGGKIFDGTPDRARRSAEVIEAYLGSYAD